MRLQACLAALYLVFCLTTAKADSGAPNLSTALSTAKHLDHRFTLSVDADDVELPKDADSPVPGTDVDQIALTYDQAERDFGAVHAIAPPKMVVLNTAPDEPNIYQGMPAGDDLVLLADSLSDTQWQAITSSTGLAVSGLDEKQRQLFTALLPHGRLKIAPWYGTNIFYTDNQIRDLSESLDQTRIRLARTPTVLIIYGNKGGYPINSVPDADNSDRWKLVSREVWGGSQDTVYGVKVRAEVPNEPKNSALDYSANFLQVPIDTSRVHTIADIVKEIASETNVELYADARLEQKSVMILPPSSHVDPHDNKPQNEALAGDLLQALAFCVTGTWRQVGPAYILTDDIVGIGTRTQLWYEFERQVDDLRREQVNAAGADVLAHHAPDDIGWFGLGEAWTPEEMKAQRFGGKQSVYLPELDMPYSQFTPAQQSLILRADRQFAHDYSEQYKHEGLSPPIASSRIRLTASIQLQLLVPTIAKPIDADLSMSDVGLFYVAPEHHETDEGRRHSMTITAMAEYLKTHEGSLERLRKVDPKLLDRILSPPPPKPVSPQAALKGIAHRAIIIRATSPSDVKLKIDQAAKLGFNEIWFMVFENGVANVAGSKLSKAQTAREGQDAIDAAITEGRNQRIDIYACLDLLAWGTTPPSDTYDYTILGETSSQAWARENIFVAHHNSSLEYEQGMTALDRPNDPYSVFVDPFSPKVGEPLADLILNLAKRPGLKGMVWRGISPTGYGPPHPEFSTSSLPLGFNQELRLGFIRKTHVDPVDLVSPNYYHGKANVSLPMFDSNQTLNSVVPKWLAYRFDSSSAFLQQLFDTAEPAGTAGPTIIVTPRGHFSGPNNDYVTWDDRSTVPSHHVGGESVTADSDDNPVSPELHRVAYRQLSINALSDLVNPDNLDFGGAMSKPTAIVVDLTTKDHIEDDPMKALADAVGVKLISQSSN